MILPTKHISTQNSLLGVGATILLHLDQPRTVTALWERVRDLSEIRVFEKFVLALDFLYAIDAIDIDNGLLVRSRK